MSKLIWLFLILNAVPALAVETAQPTSLAELVSYDWDGESLTVYYDGNCGQLDITPVFQFGMDAGRGVRLADVRLETPVNTLGGCTRVGGLYRKKILNISDLALVAATKAGIDTINPYIKFRFIAAFGERRTEPGSRIDDSGKQGAALDK